jgi:hypothetical protein
MGVTADDLRRAAAFGPGLWRFTRRPMSLEDARLEFERRLANREANFLGVLRQGVFAHPPSPYLRLLRWADCEYGDVERMVRDRGLETALEALHGAGVFVTFDEFKGREPIVRDGRSFSPSPQDFVNPLVRPYSFGRTGGSTGPSVRVPLSWAGQRDVAVNVMLHQHAHELFDTPQAFWFSTPEISVQSMMLGARFDKAPEAWFLPPLETEPPSRRAFLRYFVLAGRMAGMRVPAPQPISLDQAGIVARWAAQARDRHGTALVQGYMSQMVRVAVAASEAGIDLSGVTLTGSGEPTTPGKMQAITATGARFVSEYWSNELGPVAFGCARPIDGSDLHLQRDRLAMTQRPQAVPGSDLTVDAFCFTSLLPSAAMIMLNTELDDYGVFERRSCGCPMEAYGLTEHVRDVRSYRKLTGEGITLVGGAMEHILEDVLPARFGGSALDYQLVEDEDDNGLTRLRLVVSPRVAIPDERSVVRCVLDAIQKSDRLGEATATLWEQAGTLQVIRQEPTRTSAGKLMPLHVVRNRGAAPHRPETAAGER